MEANRTVTKPSNSEIQGVWKKKIAADKNQPNLIRAIKRQVRNWGVEVNATPPESCRPEVVALRSNTQQLDWAAHAPDFWATVLTTGSSQKENLQEMYKSYVEFVLMSYQLCIHFFFFL